MGERVVEVWLNRGQVPIHYYIGKYCSPDPAIPGSEGCAAILIPFEPIRYDFESVDIVDQRKVAQDYTSTMALLSWEERFGLAVEYANYDWIESRCTIEQECIPP